MPKPIKLKQGKTSLTSADKSIPTPTMAFCHFEGSITITWKSNGATKVVSSTAGRTFDLSEVALAVVTSGTWSFE